MDEQNQEILRLQKEKESLEESRDFWCEQYIRLLEQCTKGVGCHMDDYTWAQLQRDRDEGPSPFEGEENEFDECTIYPLYTAGRDSIYQRPDLL